MIRETLVSQSIPTCARENHQHATLDLADCSKGEHSLEVGVLVGSDYYWDLVTGGVCHRSSGPTAIRNKLG